MIEIALIVIAKIAAVAAEQLITTNTRKNDRHITARKLGNEVGCDKRRIENWLVHVP